MVIRNLRIQLSLSLVLLFTTAVACAQTMSAQEQAKQFNTAAIALQTAGKLQEAADEYRKAIKVYPEGAGAHNNLACVLKELKQFPQAEKEAAFAIKLKPRRADYRYNMGLIEQRQDKWKEAE